MKSLQSKTKFLFSRLESHGLIDFIDKANFFYDEPKIYAYGAKFMYPKKYTDGIALNDPVTSFGISFFSPYEALIKCLGEGIERISLQAFKKKNIIFSTKAKLQQKAMDLTQYYQDFGDHKDDSIDYLRLGWIRGVNLTDNIPCLLPAQQIYLNFALTYKEFAISSLISTGAAGGFNHEETLMRGIYEIVERDAFITMYLNKISPPQLIIKDINDEKIQQIEESCTKYNLDLHVFDITNDLGIPTFMTLLIDHTGLGPAVMIGLKSGFDITNTIRGSIGEAIAGRYITRKRMYQKKTNIFRINPNAITTLKERSLYWSSTNMINKLDFLFEGSTIKPRAYRAFKNVKQEIKFLKDLLVKKTYDIFYIDITLDVFRKIGYLIYKAIIPKLQPLYLHEAHKEIKIERIRGVAEYFNKKKYTMNPIPHPFL